MAVRVGAQIKVGTSRRKRQWQPTSQYSDGAEAGGTSSVIENLRAPVGMPLDLPQIGIFNFSK